MNVNEEFLEAIRNTNFTINVKCPTDEESSPEAIRKAQLSDVAAAVEANGEYTPEQISEITCLPLWNVRRCLEALGLSSPSGSESAPRSRKPRPRSQHLAWSRPSRRTA